MNELPKIGRPNKSGLSIKVLGSREYFRRLSEQKRREQGVQPRFKTGIAFSLLPYKDYRAGYRFLIKESRNPHND